MNDSLGAFVLRLKLDYSVRLLEFSDEPINEIAYKIEFKAPSSFNKSFKKRFGVSPVEFRRTKETLIPFEIINQKNQIMELSIKPKIKEIKPKKVVYVRSIGAYGGEEMGKAWAKLFEFIKQKKIFSFGMESVGISYDNPEITESEKCRYDACVSIKKKSSTGRRNWGSGNSGWEIRNLRYQGPYSNLGHVYNYIYRNWLPASNYKLRDAPSFDKYLNNPEKTKPEKLKTHIYLPIK